MNNIWRLFLARNREFYRDKGSLSWSILFPLLLIFGLSFALTNDKYVYKIGVFGEIAPVQAQFKGVPGLEFVSYSDHDLAHQRLQQRQLDLVIQSGTPTQYWVNPNAKKSFFLEKILPQTAAAPWVRHSVQGPDIGYLAWVIPGVLSMSLMFSCLYGVGYVITRYRDSGVLKRLMATPITAFEFLGAQALSRLIISVSTLTVVFTGSYFLLRFPVQGSGLLLLLIAILGALTMIALSLLCAARIDSLELMNGVLNLISWPMILLSGLWFPLDNAPTIVQWASQMIPLTHVVNAARAVMLEGAGFQAILPQLITLVVLATVLMTLATLSFRWQKSN
jgi:ABC-type multidrug transport system permease subunit